MTSSSFKGTDQRKVAAHVWDSSTEDVEPQARGFKNSLAYTLGC